MMSWFWIAAGGALGAMARYWLAGAVFRWAGQPFPYGTLAVNLLGSFAIGVAWVWLIQQQWGSDHHKQILMVGFLGAFTTFSTFSLESIALLQQERWLAFGSYVGLSVVGCLLATAAGIWCSKSLV